MSTNILDFQRSGQDRNRADINKIVQLLNDIYAPPVEKQGVKGRIVLHQPKRSRSTTVTVGEPNVLKTESRDRLAVNGIRRKVPTSVSLYPLTHTTTGTLSFPGSNGKFGCRCDFSGSSYITITTDSTLNPTTQISIALWIYSPATSADGIIVRKNNQYELKFTSGNGISWRIYSGGAWKTALTTTFTPNTWTHIAATYKSTSSGQKLYKNASLVASDSDTGSINTTSNNLGIGSDAGTATVVNLTRMAVITMLSSEASSTWITNHMDGLIDMSSYTEMTNIPMNGDASPQPNAQIPFFKLS